MRLTTPEVASIINSCEQFCTDMNVELRLFGHRVSDYDEGNDIGLMLIAENEDDEISLERNKVNIISQVSKQVADQPIEVLVTTREALRTHQRAHDLLPESMFLHAFKKA